jgi:hypothetical protein
MIYLAQALVALLGAYHVVMVWNRVGRQRFRNEQELEQFLAEFEPAVAAGDFAKAQAVCEGDPRAVPQLAQVAVQNRGLGYAKLKHLVMDSATCSRTLSNGSVGSIRLSRRSRCWVFSER